jgi:hypothetical protein
LDVNQVDYKGKALKTTIALDKAVIVAPEAQIK